MTPVDALSFDFEHWLSAMLFRDVTNLEIHSNRSTSENGVENSSCGWEI